MFRWLKRLLVCGGSAGHDEVRVKRADGRSIWECERCGHQREIVTPHPAFEYSFRGYDTAAARRGYERAQQHSATGRPIPKPDRDRVGDSRLRKVK